VESAVGENSVPWRSPAVLRSDTCAPSVRSARSPDFTWSCCGGEESASRRGHSSGSSCSSAASRVSHARGRARPSKRCGRIREAVGVAGGYVWSAHLLLLSAQTSAPNGLANHSGLVGRYLTGHRNVQRSSPFASALSGYQRAAVS
jgi:hypothetical protein